MKSKRNTLRKGFAVARAMGWSRFLYSIRNIGQAALAVFILWTTIAWLVAETREAFFWQMDQMFWMTLLVFAIYTLQHIYRLGHIAQSRPKFYLYQNGLHPARKD